jgi:hypothetical protein
MSLDMYLVGPDDARIAGMQLEQEAHDALMRCVGLRTCPILSRLADYYSDAFIAKEEVDHVCAEVENLLKEAQTLSTDGQRILRDLLALLKHARAINAHVEAIAD